MPAGETSVEAVGAVVVREFVLLAVNGEDSSVDTVGVASQGCSVVGVSVLREIALDIVESQDYVGVDTVLVRNHY